MPENTSSVAAILICAVVFAATAGKQSLAKEKLGFDLEGALVPEKEIRRGTQRRDSIPSLDDPEFIHASRVGYLDPDDRVLGISRNGVHRAYPIAILNYHEIVNDRFDDEGIVVTYCPLCGSGMAFKSTVKGRELEFGVSGLLYNNDVLLYDRQTESLWSQLKSKAITGPMKATVLEYIAITHTTWRDWLARYPDTKVLSPETGHRADYRVDPYPGYGNTGRIYFPVAESSKLYRRKEIVMGLEIDEQFRAYPFEELEDSPARFRDSFAGREFEVVYDQKNETARVLDDSGAEIPTTMAFWFAWYAFHPDGDVYTAEDRAAD